MSKKGYVIVNFGGPRSREEIAPFLHALLTDKDVIHSPFPQPLHTLFFARVAKKRAGILVHDYAKIGGCSPIWSDTEYVADALRSRLGAPVLTFHRYLPATHASFLAEIAALKCEEIVLFPMFPQFTYATTGSIARFFKKSLSPSLLKKLRWIKSYPSHPAYISAMVDAMRDHIGKIGVSQEETFFLFSAHGLPQAFIEKGDLYAYECALSFEHMMKQFPKAEGILCYQSKFGRGEWLRPYTIDLCQQIDKYSKGRKYCLFVPLSFTSDHIETLFEVEELYMPLITTQGLHSFRIPALNRRPAWIAAIADILATATPCPTPMLIR